MALSVPHGNPDTFRSKLWKEPHTNKEKVATLTYPPDETRPNKRPKTVLHLATLAIKMNMLFESKYAFTENTD